MSSGGWCIATIVGVPVLLARRCSSQSTSSDPSSRPCTDVSQPTIRSPPASTANCVRSASRSWLPATTWIGIVRRCHQLGGERVLGRVAGVGDVAREQHRVGQRAQRQDAVHGGAQRVVRGLVVEPDVRVGELGDQRRGHTLER